MQEHRRSNSDAIALDRSDERSFADRERSQETPNRDLLAEARRGLEEIGKIVAGREILAFAAKGDQPDRGVAATASIASASAAYIATVMALRRSGRARVIARTPSFRSTLTCSLIPASQTQMTR